MKPTSQSVQTPRRDSFPNAPRRFPVTNCNYQSVTLDGYRGGCAQAIAPSFRNISSDYFKTEAARDFVTEAAVFALITLTAAIPVINNLQAMAHFVRAIGGI